MNSPIPHQDAQDDRPRRPARPGRRLVYAGSAAVSLGVHLAVMLAMLFARPDPPPFPVEAESSPVLVTLVEPLRPPRPDSPSPGGAPAPAAAAVALPAPAAAAPVPAPPSPVRPTPRLRPTPVRPPTDVAPVPVATAPAPAPMPTLGDAQLAGAITAGSGAGTGGAGQQAGSGTGSGTGSGSGPSGGACNMVRRLQDELRGDAEIQAAVARAHRNAGAGGRALLVWNGDWIQEPGQEGKGLAGVRQAIGLEVAFAPQSCRAQTMSGYVVISMGDAPGSPRLALGTGRWRWSDLLDARR